jgi:hypothetical protein
MARLQAMGEAHGPRGHSSDTLALANKARYHEAVSWWSHRLAKERAMDIWDISADQRHQRVVLWTGWTARGVIGPLVPPFVLGGGSGGAWHGPTCAVGPGGPSSPA